MYTSHQLVTDLRVTPQQILARELLALSADDLAQRIEAEMMSNPALDWRGEPPRLGRAASTGDIDFTADTLQTPQSLNDYLLDQLRLQVNEADLFLAEEIIDRLDQHGWLPETATELAVALETPVDRVAALVKRLQGLDPPGIGARDARETLLIQLDQLEGRPPALVALARRLLTDHYELFVHQAWPKLGRALGIRVAEVETVVAFMQANLTPYPALTFWGETENDLRPDPVVIISQNPHQPDDGYQIHIVEAKRYRLHVPRAAQRAGATSAEFGEYIQRARLFMSSLQRRWQTLGRVTAALVEAQAEYVRHGPRYRQALTRTELANWLGLHESTISRTVKGKFAQLPDGRIVPLSEFFTTDAPIKEALRTLIADEEHPLTDQDLAERLSLRGFAVSRRTITKYRSELNIPATYRRVRRAARV